MIDVDIHSKIFNAADGSRLLAIEGLHFSLPVDSFTCLVGPSGCGKTTTLRILLGLDTDFTGQVDVDRGVRLGVVFQEPRLLPWRTVEQNVRLALPPELIDTSLDALFDELGLQQHRTFYPTELSLGLARRVALARAFAIQPGLLILDEPFVSLDDETAGRLRQLLLRVWSTRPVAALMVTHNLREAVELSDRILFLSPQPARVVAEYTIDIPRTERDRGTIDAILNDLSEYPTRTG